MRCAGEAVAFVVAETLDIARDAAEAIEVTFEPLPILTSAAAAAATGAPAIWTDNPGNEAFFHEMGDKAAVDAALKSAAHVVRHTIVINRVTANSMEPRGCVGFWDAVDERYTIRCTIQSGHGTRAALAGIFKAPHNKFRVVCDNMGGGFGMKGGCYPEYGLSLWASEVVGRPVRWIGERAEGLLSDEQSRGSVVETELALDKDMKFLALRARWKAAIGAYYSLRPLHHSAHRRARLPHQHLYDPRRPRAGPCDLHQHHDRSRPIAAADGPSRCSSPRPSSTRRRAISASIRPSCAGATPFRRAPCLIRRRRARPTIPAISRRTSRTRWRSPTTARSPSAAPRRRRAARSWASASRPRSPRTGGRDFEHAEIRFDPPAASRS